LGTLWIVSDREEHFDSGHARALTELAAFVGIALRMLRSEQRLHQTLEAQEKAAEVTLRNSEQQFRRLVQGVTDYSIYMLDLDGRVAAGTQAHNGSKATGPRRLSASISRGFTRRKIGKMARTNETRIFVA
jgi:GAF domain-containing protein